MQECVVDVSGANSWSDFIAAFNDGFIRQLGIEWNGNLDSFNDILYWPEERPYRLLVRGWVASKSTLSPGFTTCFGGHR